MNMAPKGRIPAIRILEGLKTTYLKRQTTSEPKQATDVQYRHSPHELVHVPALLGHLPGDLVGAHRVVVRLLAEAKVVAQVYQRHGDAEPHAQQGQHGGEGHLRRGDEICRRCRARC